MYTAFKGLIAFKGNNSFNACYFCSNVSFKNIPIFFK